jgi:hypothetical protein
MGGVRIGFPIAGRAEERGDWRNARPGGADRSTLTLAVELRKVGHHPIVIVHRSGPTIDHVEHLGLDWRMLDFAPVDKRQPLDDAILADYRARTPQVRALLEECGVAAVHTNDAGLHRT